VDDGGRGTELVRGERNELTLHLVGLLERDARFALLHKQAAALEREHG
jgi:hypothetical protein